MCAKLENSKGRQFPKTHEFHQVVIIANIDEPAGKCLINGNNNIVPIRVANPNNSFGLLEEDAILAFVSYVLHESK